LADRIARAAASTAWPSGALGPGREAGAKVTEVSVQAASAGRIRLTGPAGGPWLAVIASAVTAATWSGLSADFTQRELAATMDGMSEFRGASYWR